jgi:hypothetical protein
LAGENVFGPAVDDAIMRELYPNGVPAAPPPGLDPNGQDPMRATAQALGLIERHLDPITTENMAGLALLAISGSPTLEAIGQLWRELYFLRGDSGPLISALEYASLTRQFKGVQGSLFGGKRGIFGGANEPGGRRGV